MTDPGPPQWERSVLEKVALRALDEQRRTRQWNAMFLAGALTRAAAELKTLWPGAGGCGRSGSPGRR